MAKFFHFAHASTSLVNLLPSGHLHSPVPEPLHHLCPLQPPLPALTIQSRSISYFPFWTPLSLKLSLHTPSPLEFHLLADFQWKRKNVLILKLLMTNMDFWVHILRKLALKRRKNRQLEKAKPNPKKEVPEVGLWASQLTGKPLPACTFQTLEHKP